MLGAQPILLSQINLSNCRMHIMSDGQTLSTGQGSNCLGNPLNAAVWLANRMVAMGTRYKRVTFCPSGSRPMVTMQPLPDTHSTYQAWAPSA